MLITRTNARPGEQHSLTAAKRLTRDNPGLFIEETLFSCLARFCRHSKGNFEHIAELFKPVVPQFDTDEMVRLVDLSAGETAHADFAQTDSCFCTNLATARPEAVLAALWMHPASNEPFRVIFEKWLSGKAKEVQDWQTGNPDPMAARFGELCRLFKLTRGESEALAMAVMAKQKYGGVEQISGRLGPWGTAVRGALLGISPEEYVRLLAPKGRLRRFGCLKDDGCLGADLWTYLLGVDDAPLTGRYFRKSEDPALPWDFFGELASKHGEFLKRMITSASPRRGVNILLYGEPGTGKSSFARALARELGRDAFLVTQNYYRDGNSVTTSFRFTALRVCDGQVPPETSLIIVDEADAMLEGRGGSIPGLHLFGGLPRHEEKGALNDVLDENHAPCVWITNSHADWLDPSNRRRFDYSVRFDKMTREQQTAVWRNAAQRHGIGDTLSADLLARIAGRYAVSAGGIDLALRNLSALLKEGAAQQTDAEATLATLLDAHVSLLGGPGVARQQACAGYSLEGLNIKGDVALSRIESAVSRFIEARDHKGDADPDRPRMNLLLSGPSGTGKTEFVKYLGAALGTLVVTRMGSDLLDKYVGGTEQNIKRAFAEAAAEKSILFLDEVDGLLQSRERAVRSWEVTQVNELLYQMENFEGVLICATNFVDNLDPATIRRFTFKLSFEYLTDEGKRLFFSRLFAAFGIGQLAPDEELRLRRIPNLAPGDFRTVRQGLYYLGAGATAAQILDGLERESTAKQGSKAGSRIGFR